MMNARFSFSSAVFRRHTQHAADASARASCTPRFIFSFGRLHGQPPVAVILLFICLCAQRKAQLHVLLNAMQAAAGSAA